MGGLLATCVLVLTELGMNDYKSSVPALVVISLDGGNEEVAILRRWPALLEQRYRQAFFGCQNWW